MSQTRRTPICHFTEYTVHNRQEDPLAWPSLMSIEPLQYTTRLGTNELLQSVNSIIYQQKRGKTPREDT